MNKGRTLEETATLFDGETVPQELTNLGGEAATMSMSRVPAYFQETSVRYEKAQVAHQENYEMGHTHSRALSRNIS